MSNKPPATDRRRISRVAALAAVIATLGIGSLQAAPAGASARATAPAVATAHAAAHPASPHLAASTWNLVGIFPDPVTCTIAGATTGRPYYCGFYFFFWGLNVLS